MSNKGNLEVNQDNYQKLYQENQLFLKYPSDWIIRFHNMYLKNHVPGGRMLDYGFGSGNNSVFFIQKGYTVHGVEVAGSAFPQLRANFEANRIDLRLADNFQKIDPGTVKLPFQNDFFDFILSNQVLYYLSSEDQIKAVSKEICRCLRPGGIVFFTMMGPKNYYVTEKTKRKLNDHVHEIAIEDPSHRLYGVKEVVYVVQNETELRSIFSDFECLSVGYYDQSMFDIKSCFHWIFIGKKR